MEAWLLRVCFYVPDKDALLETRVNTRQDDLRTEEDTAAGSVTRSNGISVLGKKHHLGSTMTLHRAWKWETQLELTSQSAPGRLSLESKSTAATVPPSQSQGVNSAEHFGERVPNACN